MLRLCLAASGGGHLRQILDLKPVWEKAPYVIVTEDTALGRSLAVEHQVEFVDHFALGQAKLGHPWAMARSAMRNFVQSVRIIVRHKPDVVISTGAGAVFWAAMVAKLFGAKVILIDSFARWDRPSLFARLLKPFANEIVVQSHAIGQVWPEARIFDPLRVLQKPRPPKESLLFVTVGATLGFPRMVDAVLDLKTTGKIPERIIMQVGDTKIGRPIPADIEVHKDLSFEEMKQILSRSDLVICHGGTGSIITALQAGCRTIVFPRRFSRGEHYDEHQLEISGAMEARGLAIMVEDEADLMSALERARGADPKVATTDTSELAQFIAERMQTWSSAARPNRL
jgi:UDP-N-acetylglucosamine transferase subunit ALG13